MAWKKRVKAREHVAPGAEKVKVNLSLEAEVARLLSAYAGFRGERVSDVVTRAVTREMSGFFVGSESEGVATERGYARGRALAVVRPADSPSDDAGGAGPAGQGRGAAGA